LLAAEEPIPIYRDTGFGAKPTPIAIPGFSGTPRLQVLANPARVVVDLPGVNRGDKVTKKDMLGLTSPQILRSRMAQFAVTPQPVTRLVLEVVPGTQADVTTDGNGVSILLRSGQGSVTALLGGAESASTAQESGMETEAVASAASVTSFGIAPRLFIGYTAF